MTVHDFQASVARSRAQADAPWWREIYESAFPGLRSMVYVANDGWAQRGGIDRVLVLASGRTINIDEKVRERDWPDILLERWSDVASRRPGWIQKDLACDFIAYAFVPSATCYLLPFLTLRRAWRAHGRAWIRAAERQRDGFALVRADNGDWSTESIAVPLHSLLSALSDAMTICWQPALGDALPA